MSFASRKQKKIGFVLQYYDFRNDLRELIMYLDKSFDLVLYVSREEGENLNLQNNLNWRFINSYRPSVRNKLLNLLYSIFGNRPKSRKSNLNWLRRRFGSSKKNMAAYIELILGYLSYYLPDLIQFDSYLKLLNYNKTEIDDVDVFLSFTDINDPYFFAQLIKEKKKVVSYVYSWDHSAKYHRFSRNCIDYVTWNTSIKDDLLHNHQINPLNIEIVGSTQLSLLRKFFDEGTRTINPLDSEPYIYFAASAGYKVIAEQEIAYVEHLADVLFRIAPQVKLVFRPYPLLKDWDLYYVISNKENVVFDNFRLDKKEFIFTNDDLEAKFQKIKDAIAVFHCGSTFGMEACYFETPVFFICYEDFPFNKIYQKSDSIKNYISQYHIQKYLNLKGYKNVLKTPAELKEILQLILAGNEELIMYNYAIREYSDLDTLEDISTRIAQKLLN